MLPVHQKIRKIRELRNFTQDYVAEQLEMSVKNYGLYETGKRKMTLELLDKVVKILNVSTEYVFSFDESLVLNNSFFNQQGVNGVQINQQDINLYERYIEDLKQINTLLVKQNENLQQESEKTKQENESMKQEIEKMKKEIERLK
jgi:transcriptional regulator with XRE-family HTH domain